MEKNAVLGELLYIGLVFEKGRCKSKGIWKRVYIQSLKKHIQLLKEVAECMQKPLCMVDDNLLLSRVLQEIHADEILRKYYPFCESKCGSDCSASMITYCQDEKIYIKITDLTIKLFDDIILELDKGFKRDKEKIIRMIFAAHNLPRVYLNEDEKTLFLLRQHAISPEDAFMYSKLSMDNKLLSKYNQFFA